MQFHCVVNYFGSAISSLWVFVLKGIVHICLSEALLRGFKQLLFNVYDISLLASNYELFLVF